MPPLTNGGGAARRERADWAHGPFRGPWPPMTRRRVLPGLLLGLVLGLVLGLGAASASAQAVRGGPLPPPSPLFPPDNWWNVDVSGAPVDTNSAAYLGFIGLTDGIHPDWGGDSSPSPEIYGMVYVTVGGDQPLEPVAFDYADQSDDCAPGRPPGYPIPVEAKTPPTGIEGGYAGNAGVGGDKHMLIVDRDNRLLFETWNTRCVPDGSPSCTWEAGSGAIFSLDSNQQRPDGWTSADAAGLAILPGLVRYDEAYGTEPIRHALRFTVREVDGYVFPASHDATTASGPNRPPLGARLRLKPGVLPTIPSDATASDTAAILRIVQALKTYGLILADNGSDMYVQGAYDTRWDNGIWNPALGSLRAQDFEVIQLGWKPPATSSAGPTEYFTLEPCRVADTRTSPGPYGGPALAPGGQRVFVAAGRCQVPSTARALSVNLTVIAGAAPGDLRLFPGDADAPLASTVNFLAGQTRANNAIVRLAGSGSGAFAVQNDGTDASHLVVDVNGYFE